MKDQPIAPVPRYCAHVGGTYTFIGNVDGAAIYVRSDDKLYCCPAPGIRYGGEPIGHHTVPHWFARSPSWAQGRSFAIPTQLQIDFIEAHAALMS